MSRKVWFEIWGTGQYDHVLLAKVKSQGLAHIVANELVKHYKNIEIK